jgi:GTP cyclohydrolase II
MKSYIPSKPYTAKEGENNFIERVKREAATKQLVFVNFKGKKRAVLFGTEGQIITYFGKFQMVPAKVLFGRWGWHYVMLYPNLKILLKKKDIILRLDSGCFSGMVLGDITCDCHEQLKMSQRYCAENGGGIVIEIPEHDGMGNKEIKMAEKRLTDEIGMSLVMATEIFRGKKVDARTYEESAIILKALGFKNHTFKMATNNPKKVQAFKQAGMKLSGVQSVRAKNPNVFVKNRITAKEKFWGHNFNNK